ncbi:MAG: phosphotransferase [Helicobacter sp.]|nr:phosphotransferase [Helicobacteraceae bacterium]MDY3114099.1 phosphotransferase [Helicobacter sp.]
MIAIILCAGIGSRLAPMTYIKPKPLLEINGISLLENMIYYLKKGGVSDIIVVCGYKAESFLKLGLDCKIINFSDYKNNNSAASLKFIQNYLQKGTIILNGDLYIKKDFCHLLKRDSTSILAQKIEVDSSAWGYIVDRNSKILDIDTHATSGWGDGVAFFDNEDEIKLFKEALNQCKNSDYWEEAIIKTLECINYYATFLDDLYIEIDSFCDANSLLSPLDIAKQCSSDGSAIRLAGITNTNYLINFLGTKKVIRIPGVGTQKVIDRENEKEILKLIAPLNITPENEFFGSGIKFSDFLSDYKALEFCDICDSTLRQIVEILAKLHSFKHKDFPHFKKIYLLEEIKKYETLACINLTTKLEHKFLLDTARELDAGEFVLCHRDLQLPNILSNKIDIKIIDFEYAGFSNIIFELGNMSAELLLNREQKEFLLNAYNAKNGVNLSYKDLLKGELISNYIWSLWGWIYDRVDLGRDYLSRFHKNLAELV